MKTAMNKEIKAMFGSTDKILQALEAEQIRRLNLTKEDLQNHTVNWRNRIFLTIKESDLLLI